MKKIALGLLLAFPLLLFVRGCKKNPPPLKESATKAQTQSTELLKPALDLLRPATEATQYRDALHLLNSYLTRDPDRQIIPLSTDEKNALKKLYRLDDEEMAELSAGLFRPLDAYYLQTCFLFRDVSRLLELGNVTPLEQARLCFAWVMRRLPLHEQVEEGLPPAFVLRRGFGGARDRALVFLTLLRQFEIEGCVLAAPGASSAPTLAGVLLSPENADEPALFLFDVRLGQPVVGLNGKGIATLSDVRAHPLLLKESTIAPAEVARLEVSDAVPLEGLSARMRYLQDLLAFHDKVTLFQDAPRLQRDLSKVLGRPLQTFAESNKEQSPARALRQFVSSEEGGIDKRGRLQLFQFYQVPQVLIDLQLQEMRLFNPNDLPEPALLVLRRLAHELFTTFVLPSREYFLRGQFDAALKRLGRIRNVLETEEAAKPLDEDFRKQLAVWRLKVREAYLSLLVRKEAAGEAKVSALWSEDRYLANVLQVDSEVPLETFEKKIVSLILLNACREPLGQQVDYLVACCLHEKAARLQAGLDSLAAAGKDFSNIKEDAKFAWRSARGAWTKYLDRYQLNMQSLPRRLAEINQGWQRGPLEPIALWELVHHDLHSAFEARLDLDEAQKQLKTNRAALQDLARDLEAFQNSDLPKSLARDLERVQGTPLLAGRLKLLQRDWEPQGNISALLQTAHARGK